MGPARRIGWGVAAIGGLILFGWAAGVPLLRSLFPHQVEAKPNAGVCFVLLGLALAFLPDASGTGAWWRRAAPVAGTLAALALSFLTLGEYVTGGDWGVDRLLFTESSAAHDTVHPGRMTLPATLSFILLGTALLMLLPGGWRGRRLASLPALVAAVVAALAFFGHLFDAPRLASFGPYTPLPAPTGISLLLLSAGVILAADSSVAARARRSGLLIGFAAALVLLVLLGLAVLHNARLLVENNRRVNHTHEVIERLGSTLSAVQDLETGSRGYLLTGNPAFLEPAEDAPQAARRHVSLLRELVADNPAQLHRLDAMARLIEDKFGSTERQLELYRLRGEDEAQRLVARGEGKRLMDEIRDTVAEMETEERRLLGLRQARAEASTGRTLLALATGLTACVGSLIAIFVLLRREIRARTQLAAQLRRSEESLAVTLSSIGDGVLATDTRGLITMLNPVAEELTGWRQAEARGRPIAEVFRIIHEGTRAPAPLPVEEVLTTGEIRGLANHTALISRDGTERAIADSAAPIRDAAGNVLGVVLVFRDVTESRRAQAQLDRFFELSLDFLCIASADGYFKRASPAVTDILGWSVEEFLATPFMEQIHPDDRASATKEMERQAAGEKVMHFECRFRHKDGTWRLLAWRSSPYDGLMYASARDVTEARQAEARIYDLNRVLQQRAAQLEAANRELESFSYSVSHDLRAPLRHVQGYVEMLAREAQAGLSDKGRRYLNTIAEAAREMGVLIDDLLAFSRMGRTEMHQAVVDPRPLVTEVRLMLEPDTQGRNIHWILGDLPPVRADAAMLRQVLANLVGNAVKYTRKRPEAVIEIGFSGVEEERLVFFVRDNGAGFDMKYADKLFGVFQRLHRTDEFEGTGIGLASVRRIIGRHGGRTWAQARVGEGATFFFTLQPAGAPGPATQASS